MEHTLALPHGTLAWTDHGPTHASLTLVLLHGFPHDHALWVGQTGSAADTFPDTRLLVPDLPGLGRSSPLPVTTMDTYADAVVAMLDAAGVQHAVIGGLSMGGYVAFALWRRHPSRVRGLILMDTRAAADTEAAREKRRDLIATVHRDGVGAVVPGMLPTQLGETTRLEQPALVERVEVMLRRAPASGVVAAAMALMERVDSTETLESITVPTLVVVGEEDTITPVSEALTMAAGIRGSRLATIPAAGHLAPLEQPAVVNAAIAEFLDVVVR